MKIVAPDLNVITTAIANDFPRLKIANVRLIKNGWDNVVAEVDNRFIFRFPKDSGDSEYRGIRKKFEREIKILDYLKDKITIAIPGIEFIGTTFSCMGYRKIPGNDLTRKIFDAMNVEQKQKLVFNLADFLREMHSALSIEEAHGMGFENVAPGYYPDMIKRILPGKIRNSRILDFIEQTCAEYTEMIGKRTELVFLYNDLHTENMAVDYTAKKLNGIFDFSDIMIGDVNMDFYPLYKFDPCFMRAVAEKYQKQTGRSLVLRRMVLYARINELCDLAEFVDKPESRVYKNAMARIEKWKKEINIFKAQ